MMLLGIIKVQIINPLHLNILEMAELYLLKQRIMEKLLVQFGMI